MTETPTANKDIESPSDPGNSGQPSQASSSPKPHSGKILFLAVVALGGLVWGSVMTALYVNETKKNAYDNEVLLSPVTAADTKLRSNGALGMSALSHINVVVNDSIDTGAEYYEMLGFYPATNADGPMKYTNITNHGFCVDAGFETCRVDIIFLKHETINIYLELFFYYEPEGNLQIPIFDTNDAGGIRHIAVEVEDAVKTYNDIKAQNHQGKVRLHDTYVIKYCSSLAYHNFPLQFITKDTPIPLDPFPYTFMYWIDKYGVQWEFEQGRPVEYYHVAGITG